jgi:hypothetical protein
MSWLKNWMGKRAANMELRLLKVCLDYLKTNFPEMNPSSTQVFCTERDAFTGRPYQHWAFTLTNRSGVDYNFSRCRGEWKLQMRDTDFPRGVKTIDPRDLYGDIRSMVKIALDSRENDYGIFSGFKLD